MLVGEFVLWRCSRWYLRVDLADGCDAGSLFGIDVAGILLLCGFGAILFCVDIALKRGVGLLTSTLFLCECGRLYGCSTVSGPAADGRKVGDDILLAEQQGGECIISGQGGELCH